MFEINVKTEFNASHQLRLPGGSVEDLHNHRWQVCASVSSEKLNNIGLVMDFHRLKNLIVDITSQFEGKMLNELDYFAVNNPSAENAAKYIYDKLKVSLPVGVVLNHVSVVEEPSCQAKYSE